MEIEFIFFNISRKIISCKILIFILSSFYGFYSLLYWIISFCYFHYCLFIVNPNFSKYFLAFFLVNLYILLLLRISDESLFFCVYNDLYSIKYLNFFKWLNKWIVKLKNQRIPRFLYQKRKTGYRTKHYRISKTIWRASSSC